MGAFLAFVAVLVVLGGLVVFFNYRRHLLGGGGNIFASFGVERALVSFEEQSRSLGHGVLTVDASWGLASDALVSRGPASQTYRVLVRVSSPRLPPFLWLGERPASVASEPPPAWTTELLQLLEKPQQAAVEHGLQAGVQVTAGVVEKRGLVSASDRVADVQLRLVEGRDRAIEVAERLSALGPRAAAWLATCALEQERWQRRLEALDLLCRHYPEAEETRSACARAMSDGSQPEQVRAALQLGPEALRQLPPDLDPQLVPEALWAEAMAALTEVLPADRLRPLLERSLEVVSLPVLRVVLGGLQRHGLKPPLPPLVRMTKATRDAELLLLIIDALGRSRDDRAEPALLSLFGRSGGAPAARREALQQALVLALVRSGTVRAVPLLRQLAADEGTPAALRAACHSAVAEIQARLEGVVPGGLALAEAQESGALSLTDEGGELTLTDEGDAD